MYSFSQKKFHWTKKCSIDHRLKIFRLGSWKFDFLKTIAAAFSPKTSPLYVVCKFDATFWDVFARGLSIQHHFFKNAFCTKMLFAASEMHFQKNRPNFSLSKSDKPLFSPKKLFVPKVTYGQFSSCLDKPFVYFFDSTPKTFREVLLFMSFFENNSSQKVFLVTWFIVWTIPSGSFSVNNREHFLCLFSVSFKTFSNQFLCQIVPLEKKQVVLTTISKKFWTNSHNFSVQFLK